MWAVLGITASAIHAGKFGAEVPPSLISLGGTWQRVRVCNIDALQLPCHGMELNVCTGISDAWKTEGSCADAGCCWNPSNGSCFGPNDQRVPADPAAVRFASNQQAPSLSNTIGQLMAVKSGNPLGVSCITVPPYAGECGTPYSFGSGLAIQLGNNLPLSFDDGSMKHKFQWFPHQVLREAEVVDGKFTAVASTVVRMPFRKPAVMLQLNISTSLTGVTGEGSVQVSVNVPALISRYANNPTWGWPTPRPSSSKNFNATVVPCGNSGLSVQCILTKDASSSAVSAIAFANPMLQPQLSVTEWPPKAVWSLDSTEIMQTGFVMFIGNDTDIVLSSAAAYARNFDTLFVQSEIDWEQFWNSVFQPPSQQDRDRVFSGNLPTLKTADDEVGRTYYMGIISLLTNVYVGEDIRDVALFGSAGPIYAYTAMYVWDTTLNSVILSLLEPRFMEYFIHAFAGPQLHQHYALDYVTNAFVGPWYSFNDWQLSRAVHTLAQFSLGDELYNQRTIGGQPLLNFVESMATFWESLTMYSSVDNLGQKRPIATSNSYNCSNLTGTWYGFWMKRGSVPELSHPVALLESANGLLQVSQQLNGWNVGNGTINGAAVVLDLYDGSSFVIRLTGELIKACHIDWDNLSGWCRNGSSANCTSGPVPKPDTLADYGKADNLLECVPTYTHKVPSLNAANVWLMRQAANMLERAGNKTRPAELRALAANVSAALRNRLYVQGKGYWACEQPDGSRVEVRHIIDFATIAQAIASDLPTSTKNEMVQFVLDELKTEFWLRALSLHDAAAPASDRKDHGPYGSYDGWLGETLSAFAELGRYDLAVNLTRGMARVYDRGPGGQSHQIFTRGDNETLDIPAKAAADQQYFALSGAVITNSIITGLFGVSPVHGVNSTDSPLPSNIIRNPTISRSNFQGTLHHLPIRGSMYSVVVDNNGVQAFLE